ncbi:MAG: nitronate monooxygenase [Cytophagales bacterium]|nr:nitronate monooxygenase [Cytophagales bacterium]
MENRVSRLFGVAYPIVQAGMVWCSGWRLASAVSEAGGLGLIGAGSMNPAILKEHIQKCKKATHRPFGVNLPLFHPQIEELVNTVVDEQVKILFTSAGSPITYTQRFKDQGITVVHVVSSVKFAIKAEIAGVDAVVAEGFEAGGHNGKEETSSMCLIPLVRDAIGIPLIAAGGIADGRSMAAAFLLGADGVQVGSRFVATIESSAHDSFKQRVVDATEGDTELVMKQLTPVRLLKNPFYQQVKTAELEGKSKEELKSLLGKGRSRLGMFEGDMEEGELEIGQVSALIHRIQPASEVVSDIWHGFLKSHWDFCQLKLD